MNESLSSWPLDEQSPMSGQTTGTLSDAALPGAAFAPDEFDANGKILTRFFVE